MSRHPLASALHVVANSRAMIRTLLLLGLSAAAISAAHGQETSSSPGPGPRALGAAPPATSNAPATTSVAGSPALEAADRRRRAADVAGPQALLLVLLPDTADGVPGSNRNADFTYLCPLAPRTAALLFGMPPVAPTAKPADGPTPPAPPRPAPATGRDATAVGGTALGADAIDRIYLPLRNPAMERWTGPEPAADAATAAAAGFREARPLDALAEDLASLSLDRTTLLVSWGPTAAGTPALAKLIAQLRERVPSRWIRLEGVPGAAKDDLPESRPPTLPPQLPAGRPTDAPLKTSPLDVRSARPTIGGLREVKSPSEIERIRRAVAATVDGHADAMRAARAGLFEYHVAAIVEFRCKAGGCRRQAYPSIAGSGPWSCVLHYDRNERRLEDGDLVVVDAGGEFEGYACDVTRTWPVSGKFTAEQATVYDAVLEAQEAAIAAVRPGVTLRQVHEVARGVLAKHGLDKWFIHGTCHTVGLDVHDSWHADALLRPGCVITVEPGVYDPARNLGVRIEDTVLVTDTGGEVLSASLPKSRAGVEALMAEDLPPGMLR